MELTRHLNISPVKKYFVSFFEEYSFRNLCLLFFIYGATGKVWEILYVRFDEGNWANRGMLYGPYIPVYAVGGILILLFFRKFAKKPWLVFILSAVSCTVLEYILALTVENAFGYRLWQYDRQFLNFHGRICLLATIGFGIAGTFQACFYGPFTNRLVSKKLKKKTVLILDIILWTLFIADFVISVFIFPKTGVSVTYPIR